MKPATLERPAEPGPTMEVPASRADRTAEAAFGAFFEANVERARRMAWRLTGGDEAAAEDVVQNAFVKAFKAWDRFRGEARADTWLYRIVVNEAHNYRRWRKVRDVWHGLWSREDAPEGGRPVGDPGLRDRIGRAVDALGAGQREVFVLVHLEGFTVRETAELLGKSEGTIKTHLHRALKALRASLADLSDRPDAPSTPPSTTEDAA